MATATRGTPSGTARLTGRNDNGTARWITNPEMSEIKYTSGGRTRPRFATSRAALEPPPCCGVVVMVFSPARSIDYGPDDLTVQRSARSDVRWRPGVRPSLTMGESLL